MLSCIIFTQRRESSGRTGDEGDGEEKSDTEKIRALTYNAYPKQLTQHSHTHQAQCHIINANFVTGYMVIQLKTFLYSPIFLTRITCTMHTYSARICNLAWVFVANKSEEGGEKM